MAPDVSAVGMIPGGVRWHCARSDRCLPARTLSPRGHGDSHEPHRPPEGKRAMTAGGPAHGLRALVVIDIASSSSLRTVSRGRARTATGARPARSRSSWWRCSSRCTAFHSRSISWPDGSGAGTPARICCRTIRDTSGTRCSNGRGTLMWTHSTPPALSSSAAVSCCSPGHGMCSMRRSGAPSWRRRAPTRTSATHSTPRSHHVALPAAVADAPDAPDVSSSDLACVRLALREGPDLRAVFGGRYARSVLETAAFVPRLRSPRTTNEHDHGRRR